MSPFWSIVKRETGERRLLMLGALLLGFVPFTLPLLPGVMGRDLDAERLQVAAVLAGVATAVTALFLGGSVIARDLAERRLSFYFARPIPTWAIWGGKMAAATGLSVATGALILLPALLAGARELAGQPRLTSASVGFIALGLLAILGFSHAASLLLRTRSSWLLLDLAGILVVAWIVLEARSHLLAEGIPGFRDGRASVLVLGYRAFTLLLALAALAAGARQVAIGRTDPRRGHRIFSLTFWGIALASVLLFSALARWVTAVEAKDLRWIQAVVAAPQGSWVLTTGPAKRRPGFHPSFLVDTATGRSLRINAELFYRFWSPFSRDGRRAVWLQPHGSVPYRVMTLDLTRPDSRPQRTALFFGTPPLSVSLSPDGSRIATIESSGLRVLVQDVDRGRLLASEALASAIYLTSELRFPEIDRVQVLQRSFGPGECTVVELDLATRSSQERNCTASELLPDFTDRILVLATARFRPPRLRQVPVLGAESAPAGAPARRLFYNQRELVRIDPATGRQTVVLRLS